jgi:hypothetical protein
VGPEGRDLRPDGTNGTEGAPYEGSSVAGVLLLTVFAPFIALIVALLLRGSEQDPTRSPARSRSHSRAD